MIDGYTCQCLLPLEPLLAFALDEYPATGVRAKGIDSWASPAFQTFCEEVFEDECNLTPKRWLRHVTINKPGGPVSPSGEWLQTFPHCHDWGPAAVTMVLFLQAPEAGGELVLMPKGDRAIHIQPRPGLCAFMGGDTMHGVTPVYGKVDRIGLIVTGFGQ